MIAKQLRTDIETVINNYVKHFPRSNNALFKRDEHISHISEIIQELDPIRICQQLKRYIDTIVLPWLQWVRVLDANNFIYKLKIVLALPKYQEVNLLREMLQEKDKIIASLTKNTGQLSNGCLLLDKAVELKMTEVIEEVQLLRNENEFLYAELAVRDEKINALQIAAGAESLKTKLVHSTNNNIAGNHYTVDQAQKMTKKQL